MSASALSEPPTARLPPWIRTRPPGGERYAALKSSLRELRLGTVCEEARCPNLAECWSEGAATIMLLGTDCTRRCGFCAVTTHWPGGRVDRGEPARVGEAVARSGLRYVVLTQVCRDDLEDGGAWVLAETVREVRARAPGVLVELLIGDLGGSASALDPLLDDAPDVLAHNLETVRALSPYVRDHRASYDRSLGVLADARERGPARLVTKSSIMLGLGETPAEIDTALGELRAAGVDLVTFGQYLRPSPRHLPVVRFPAPEEFARLKARALAAGFAGAEAGPLVRSSYHAEALYRAAFDRRGS